MSILDRLFGRSATPCEECGEQKADVSEMRDPYQEQVYPEDAPWMRHLCGSCAQARFDES